MQALDLAANLIRFETPSSVSNVDITTHAEALLNNLGFQTETVPYVDPDGVPKANVIGRREPTRPADGRGLVYFGHTDVVPVPEWFTTDFHAFEPTVRDGKLYGRGSCDMKGSVACFLAAAARLKNESLTAPLSICLTADEETGFHGAREVVQNSLQFRRLVEEQPRGIIGEPTELTVVHAHKGGIAFRAISQGRAGHSATREGINANYAMIPFLNRMAELHRMTEEDPSWQDDRFSPPVISFNLGINDHTAAVNITPPQSICTVYFRPMPNRDGHELLAEAQTAAARCGLEFEVTFDSPPLWIDPETEFITDLVDMTGVERPRTVSYGTDGAMFNELRELAVIGPGSIKQAHTKDEFITLAELKRGTDFYESCIRRWCQ